MRIIGKTHTLTIDKIKWLIKPLPEVLIISSGWDNAVKVDEEIEKMKGCEVRILTTAKAMSLYNKLKKSGVRAAIHVHSTC